MGKVSIGLRGWRFDEDDVLDDDGDLRPVEEMPPDARQRVARLAELVEKPCDACWLEYRLDERDRTTTGTVVYGEPMAEVVLCPEHEPDFVYWFREDGGAAYRGTEELQEAFHEWFVREGEAPEGYEGIEHVDTAPEDLPSPPDREELADADLDLGVEYPTE